MKGGGKRSEEAGVRRVRTERKEARKGKGPNSPELDLHAVGRGTCQLEIAANSSAGALDSHRDEVNAGSLTDGGDDLGRSPGGVNEGSNVLRELATWCEKMQGREQRSASRPATRRRPRASLRQGARRPRDGGLTLEGRDVGRNGKLVEDFLGEDVTTKLRDSLASEEREGSRDSNGRDAVVLESEILHGEDRLGFLYP